MLPVETIFFDVDGTLVDATKDIVKAVNHTLTKIGVHARPPEEIISYIGTGVKDLVAKSLHDDNVPLLDKAVEVFSDYYTRHAADEARLYPRVRETLEYFKDKRKFILTNRYARLADVTLEHLGIRKYFERILGADDENCKKPSACVLEGFFKKLNIDSKKALIVGDMAIDVETGKNSGIRTCFVTYGLGKIEDLKGLDPDYIIDDIAKLKEVVSGKS